MEINKEPHLYIYGRQPVQEALRSNVKVYGLWLARNIEERTVRSIKALAQKRQIALHYVSRDDIQKITGPVVHQGVAMEVPAGRLLTEAEFERLLSEEKRPLFLVLDQIQDPHNLGAILRSADISGVTAVILPKKGSAELNATVAKTSAGAMFHVPVYRVAKIYSVLEKMNAAGVKIFAMLPNAEILIYKANFENKTAILIGNEGRGVRKNLVRYCDMVLRIPQFGKVNSLNASVSTAVVLYEALRQRFFRDE